jgi:type I restriction-modification system DNA methylase subunit
MTLVESLKRISSKVEENPMMSEDELYSILVKFGFFEALGYSKFGVDIKPQYIIPGERNKADYICRDEFGNIIFVLEAKRPGDEKLEAALNQLWERYVDPLKARYGVLTNGKRLIVYKRIGKNPELTFDFILERINEPQTKLLVQLLVKPQYDLTLLPRIQEYFAVVERLPLKTDLAKENFYETFSLSADSIFGRLVKNLVDLFDYSYPKSRFLKGAYSYWQVSLARKPEKIPLTWMPFLEREDEIYKFMFCLESAHALLARLILAKTCEDLKFPGIDISNFITSKIHQFREQVPIVGYSIVLTKLIKEMKDQLIYSIFEEDIFSWWSDAYSPYIEKSSGELIDSKIDQELEDFSSTVAKLLFALYKNDFSDIAGDPLGDLYQQYFDRETRKALGEFYTPHEIVNYILDSVKYNQSTNVRYTRLIDPACGSGTFLVEALHRYLKQVQPVAEKEGWAHVLRELCNSPKIVGLDIHPFACLIAQVRFMMELIPYYKKAIEEEKGPIFASLQRLPIFRTDSLAIEMSPLEFGKSPTLLISQDDIEFYAPLPVKRENQETVSLKVTIPSWKKASEGSQYNLFNLDEYFCVIQAIFDAVKSLSRVEGEAIPEKVLESHLRKYLSNKDFSILASFFKPYADQILFRTRGLKSEFVNGRLIKSVEDTVLSALLKNYFEYDFVVGNPPFIRVQRMNESTKLYYREKYQTAQGKFDIYAVFFERGLRWLKNGGYLGFITSNKFTQASYGKHIRKYMLSNSAIELFIDFGDSGVFSDATNYPSIIILRKDKSGEKQNHAFTAVKVNEPTISLFEKIAAHGNSEYVGEGIEVFKVFQHSLGESPWRFVSKEPLAVFDYMTRNKDSLLRDVCFNISEGIVTGANSAFIVDGRVLINENIERTMAKPVLKGENVKRWHISWNETYILYPHRLSNGKLIAEDIQKYPKLYDHLQSSETILSNRHYVKEAGKEWFEIWNPRDPRIFETTKIITPDMSTINNFALDDGHCFYCLDTCFVIVPKTDIDPTFLIGLLNSKAVEFYFKQISPFVSGKYHRYKTQYLEQIPIKLPKNKESSEIALQIARKVSQILKQSINTSDVLRDFPNNYLNAYRKNGEELDELELTINSDHEEAKPIITGQPGKGFYVYPIKEEDPIWLETQEKAYFVYLSLFGKQLKKTERVKILVPRDNAIINKILTSIGKACSNDGADSIDKLEKEIDDLVYQLYELSDIQRAIIEAFLSKTQSKQ